MVANRLPVSVHVEGDAVRLAPSSGALLASLRACHERGDGVWVGWPGESPGLSAEAQASLDLQFAERRLVAVHLSHE
jgi:trehalose 6-phosphate synthase/phosphatase